MNEESRDNSRLRELLPIVGIVFSFLAFYSKGYPSWVTATATGIGLLLVLAWLFSESGWIGKAIKFRWFRSKLPDDQAVRLSVLLDDVSNEMSYSYTLSPFYVWHNCSNNHSNITRINYHYFYSMQCWMDDLREKFDAPSIDNILLLNTLSKAVSETTKLAEAIEKEIEDLLRNEELTDQDRSRILKEWDSARNHFNQWIDKWGTLFREINKTKNLNCVDYFRPLKMIG